jgi:hypothetical protein
LFFQVRGKIFQLVQIVIAGRSPVGRLGVVEEGAGLFELQVIVNNGSKILYGITGVREKKPVHTVAVTLKDEFKAKSHHRANVRLKMGAGVADFQRRVPDLHRQRIHGPEDLLRVLGGKDPEDASAVFLLLFLEIFLS